jgi:phosphoglycolate phosphatase-like HAD superfamily hydrolase
MRWPSLYPTGFLLIHLNLIESFINPIGALIFRRRGDGRMQSASAPSTRTPNPRSSLARRRSRLAIGLKRGVKGIIFDIDGTLADSWLLGFNATLTVLAKNRIETISPEIYHSCTRYSTPERLARHAGLEPGDAAFATRGAQLAQEFDDLIVDMVSIETAGFYDDVLPFLQRIPRSIALGALTNAAVRYAHAVLQVNCPSRRAQRSGPDHEEIYGRFRSIHGADTVPLPKPSPDGLLVVCRDLGFNPDDCVYVGDSPTDGIAAHAAGMPSIGVLWGSHSREAMEKAPFAHLVSNVQDLEDLLLLSQQ